MHQRNLVLYSFGPELLRKSHAHFSPFAWESCPANPRAGDGGMGALWKPGPPVQRLEKGYQLFSAVDFSRLRNPPNQKRSEVRVLVFLLFLSSFCFSFFFFRWSILVSEFPPNQRNGAGHQSPGHRRAPAAPSAMVATTF